MPISDIIETFKESYNDNPGYYVILLLTLVMLILYLISKPNRLKPSTRQENQNIPHRPKYAAGGEMDSIRSMTPYRIRSADNTHIFIFIGIILLIIAIPYIQTQNQTQNDQAAIVPSDIDSMQNLRNVITNMEPTFSEDRTQLFITSTYTNTGATTVYSLVPSFKITGSEGELLAEQEGEYITAIPPAGHVEQTVRINFEEPVFSDTHIEQKVSYRKLH